MSIDFRKLKDEWKAKGEIPDWYSTNALQFFMDKYSFEGESVKSRDTKANEWVMQYAPEVYPDWWDQDPYFKGLSYLEALNKAEWDGYVIKSTPFKANAGLPQRGLTVSCCGQKMDNSVASKAFTRGELEILIKNSHGCSMSVSDWLAEGTVYDSDGNMSAGVEEVVTEYQEATEQINQGVRRGQTLFALDVLHGDFWKIAKKLYLERATLNISWLMTDEFLSLLKSGDEEVVKRWGEILYLRMTTGKGYFTKIDTMNRNKAQVFKNLDLKVHASNLCVAPETKLLTKNGYEVISELEGQEVEVWNGKSWSKTTVVKTGENQELFEVIVRYSIDSNTFKEVSVTCTAYHKWYDIKGNEVRTQDLELNTELLEWVTPEGERVMSYVSEIKDDGRFDSVYCANEPERHMLVFNGVLTGNCNEVNLPANDEYSFTCVIVNANLTLWDSFPKHLFHFLHMIQDCNVSGYIDMISKKTGLNALFLSKVKKFTEDFRAVGTGVAGFHSLLMQKGLVYGEFDSLLLNEEIFSRMQRDTHEMNVWLGEVLGVPEGNKKAGVMLRNATTMMMPPTKSSAELSRNSPSEGINPETAMVKIKESVGGDLPRINTAFLKVMKEKGMYNEKEVLRIAKNKGSVQDCDWLTDHEKQVFRVAFEIPMEYHLALCSQRQPYIDQQQSINLFFSGSDSEEYIAKIHKLALEDENINGLYYCYSSRGGRYVRPESCEICQ